MQETYTTNILTSYSELRIMYIFEYLFWKMHKHKASFVKVTSILRVKTKCQQRPQAILYASALLKYFSSFAAFGKVSTKDFFLHLSWLCNVILVLHNWWKSNRGFVQLMAKFAPTAEFSGSLSYCEMVHGSKILSLQKAKIDEMVHESKIISLWNGKKEYCSRSPTLSWSSINTFKLKLKKIRESRNIKFWAPQVQNDCLKQNKN